GWTRILRDADSSGSREALFLLPHIHTYGRSRDDRARGSAEGWLSRPRDLDGQTGREPAATGRQVRFRRTEDATWRQAAGRGDPRSYGLGQSRRGLAGWRSGSSQRTGFQDHGGSARFLVVSIGAQAGAAGCTGHALVEIADRPASSSPARESR